MGLQEEIEGSRATIKTDSYSMSIGEWLNMYSSGELDIHPEFQRFYRWEESQKSRFIESILLGIPIPPIFVAQTPDGVFDVVDGLQRLSTIFEFAGILKDENGDLVPPLILESTKFLPSLSSKYFEDKDDPTRCFTVDQRLFIKRARLDVNIILRESDPKAKFELFQRLNTGGSQLSDQEVRNCILVQMNRDVFFWLKDIAADSHFQNCVSLTDRSLSEQYDIELALRFLIFRNTSDEELSCLTDVGEFLTDKMVDLITNGKLDLDKEKDIFLSTFERISSIIGANAFRKFDPVRKRHIGGFLLSAFEVVAVGFGLHGGVVSLANEEIIRRIQSIWTEEIFLANSGSGVRASSRLPRLIPFGKELFNL